MTPRPGLASLRPVAAALAATTAATLIAGCGGPAGAPSSSTASSSASSATPAATEHTGSASASGTSATGETHAAPHWGYDGDAGPAHWGDLDPAFVACKTGRAQSPVDLRSPRDEQLPDLGIDYPPGAAFITNTGHAVQVTPAAGGTLTSDGKRYDLLQFHMHTPSEHTIDGRTYPAELHFVHRAGDGQLSVVGVLVERGAAHPTLEAIVAAIPAEVGAPTPLPSPISPADLLPASRLFVAYDGSLTTPPCTEGVKWRVLTATISASDAQIQRLAGLGANARPVQPLQDRPLRRDVAVDG